MHASGQVLRQRFKVAFIGHFGLIYSGFVCITMLRFLSSVLWGCFKQGVYSWRLSHVGKRFWPHAEAPSSAILVSSFQASSASPCFASQAPCWGCFYQGVFSWRLSHERISATLQDLWCCDQPLASHLRQFGYSGKCVLEECPTTSRRSGAYNSEVAG